MQTIRVFHIPYQGPYIRKIASSHIEAVNSRERYNDCSIYLRRHLLQEELDAFDVLHIHFLLHYATIQGFKNLLEQCANQGKRIIYTAHDLHTLRNDEEAHREKLNLLCAMADAVITLTSGSAETLLQQVKHQDLERKLSIIPHGFAVHPHHRSWGTAGSQGKMVQYAIYGVARHNRDILSFAQAWYNAMKDTNAQLTVLLRTPEQSQMQDKQLRIEDTLNFLRSNPQKMRVLLMPLIRDEQIIQFLSCNDVLVMPYLWSTHSGQLEMAFDLNLLPLISRVGFFADQWRWVQPYVPEPHWFARPDLPASDIHIQKILKDVQARLGEKRHHVSSSEWRSYRLWEHREILQAHYQLYVGASVVSMNLPTRS